MAKKKNGKAQNRNRTNTISSNSNTHPESPVVSISQEELKNAIVEALREYDQEKKTKSTTVAAQKTTKSKIKRFFENAWFIAKMPFMREKDIIGDNATTTFMSMILSSIFGFAKLVAIVVAIGLVSFVIGDICKNGWILAQVPYYILFVMFGFIFYLFAGLFRRVSVEVVHIEDKNYMAALLAAVGTVVSVIIAVIALLK